MNHKHNRWQICLGLIFTPSSRTNVFDTTQRHEFHCWQLILLLLLLGAGESGVGRLASQQPYHWLVLTLEEVFLSPLLRVPLLWQQVSSPATTSSFYIITNYLCVISPFIPIYSPTTKESQFHILVVLSILIGNISIIKRRCDPHSNLLI